MDLYYVYATGATIAAVLLVSMVRKSFDPFAPVWLFLLGYLQLYVIQALSYHEWAVRVRGEDLVLRANGRAFCALLWFLAVYYSGVGRKLAGWLPRPPENWSVGVVSVLTPPLFLWGLICSGFIVAMGNREISGEESLFRQFPVFMLIAGLLLVVTSRVGGKTRTLMLATGLGIVVLYVLIWMFNGKRSHSLFGVLTGLCAFYTSKGKRPSKATLAVAGFLGALVVSIAIGWRNNHTQYEASFSGFGAFVSEFDLSSILANLNMKDREEDGGKPVSYETEEYGGYLLMLATVPMRSDYDYGEVYCRLWSTYVPRLLWPDKPFYGRAQWVNAWIAGSEFPRKPDFTGPAIGILGATQLNGGAVGTGIVLAVLALLLRTAYEYFRRYSTFPWVQVWWAASFYNAWLMTVNDDPFVWFYYVYGHTTLPPLFLLFVYHKFAAPAQALDLPHWQVAGA